jgi:hypothetical protein
LVLLGCAAAILGWHGTRGVTPMPAGLVSKPATPPPIAPIPVMPCRGLIVVSDVPNHAEVLFRLGAAPVDVDRMPVGARLEFVATADSYAPRRLVVPVLGHCRARTLTRASWLHRSLAARGAW